MTPSTIGEIQDGFREYHKKQLRDLRATTSEEESEESETSENSEEDMFEVEGNVDEEGQHDTDGSVLRCHCKHCTKKGGIVQYAVKWIRTQHMGAKRALFSPRQGTICIAAALGRPTIHADKHRQHYTGQPREDQDLETQSTERGRVGRVRDIRER